MNRSELVAAMALKTGSSKKAADESLRALIEIISEELKNDGKVQLVGFGSFSVKNRAPRKGRNPQTGLEIKIPASKAPIFKPGKALKDLIK